MSRSPYYSTFRAFENEKIPIFIKFLAIFIKFYRFFAKFSLRRGKSNLIYLISAPNREKGRKTGKIVKNSEKSRKKSIFFLIFKAI